ncbi:MAG: hypothetical protein Q7V20_05380 [Aquabacterium sp.]|uniref:hypothetical protein n=1 Tax=Aquabacterium sp. TaxID=1872578 RepID=UPI0027212626|nr:hypothetical protein [Aquabacterium sp.]MDO9002867.1 hypothetical protein [Aquabacterium sp.]
MNAVQLGELPQEALLNQYKEQGVYTDCYCVDVPRAVSQAEFVETFYTTRLFKVERFILSSLLSKPSTDEQARRLAAGEVQRFAAWTVEGRTAHQLLLCDFMGRTRSWLMSVADEATRPGSTRLYFGSAFLPKVDRATGQATYGPEFHALKGFHRLYSRALLRSAQSRLLLTKPS